MTAKPRSETVSRRLLLSKEFYLQGVERCRAQDGLSRLLAIHHFHISIEITLKAILLEFGIRTEKTLNVDFEQMLADIDNHHEFKDKKKKIPFRQELRNINQQRNFAQHHVIEPHENALSDFKYFTHSFLVESFACYFEESFESISRIDIVDDSGTKALLEKAQKYIKEENYTGAVCAAAVAFNYAENMITRVLPGSGRDSVFFIASELRRAGFDSRPIISAFERINERIRGGEIFNAIIGSGISPSRLNKFISSVPRVQMAMGGNAFFNFREKPYALEDAEYSVEFVIDTVIKWQSQGLIMNISERLRKDLSKLISESWPPQKSDPVVLW